MTPPGAEAAAARHLVFAIPGRLDQATGGYGYDRRIIGGLREAAWQVDLLTLDAGYPWPDAEAQARTAKQVAAIPDGTLVVADGLAFGAIPDVAERHARRLRWVALVHHPLACEAGLSPAQQAQLSASERRALAVARTVIVTSAHTARSLGELGVPPDRITVVEPGTDRDPLRPMVQDCAEPGRPARLSLLCVATVTRRKGHQVLVDALAGLQDRAWTLNCAGSLAFDPATVAQVNEAIRAHGLQGRVRLHGEVSDQALAALYRHADVFVLPSHFEGYGMALAEALAHGLPVCSTTAGAIPDTVPSGAGVLVPPGDVAALRGALARLLDEPEWRAALAQGAWQARQALPIWPEAVARFAQALSRTSA